MRVVCTRRLRRASKRASSTQALDHRRQPKAVTGASLLRDVWYCKFVPETNLVDVHMGRLRCKVDGSNEAPMIRNIRGEGFLLSETPALAKNLPGLRGLKQSELTPTNSNNI